MSGDTNKKSQQSGKKQGFRGPSPEVGKATQFKPGQSGNPSGRPPGIFSAALMKQLRKAKSADLNAIVAGIVERAKKGDPKAFSAIRDAVDGKPAQPVDVQGDLNIQVNLVEW